MYAIFQAGGSQVKAKVGDRFLTDLLPQAQGAEVTFDKVLMIGGDSIQVGTPHVKGATVVGKVVGQPLGDKVFPYHYSQRNHARQKVGFRHHYSEVEVTAIKA